jgi:hypothetical protein
MIAEPPVDSLIDDSLESGDLQLLNAEEVTKMATEFLEGLGHKKTTPTKVAQEGLRHYVVEVDLKKRAAMVIIDANAKEIKEFEINPVKKPPKLKLPSSISIKLILVIVGIQALLLIAFNLLQSYLPLPF